MICRYTANFDPDYRYGRTLNRLPPGVWFKNNVPYELSNENEQLTITNHISKLMARYVQIVY